MAMLVKLTHRTSGRVSFAISADEADVSLNSLGPALVREFYQIDVVANMPEFTGVELTTEQLYDRSAFVAAPQWRDGQVIIVVGPLTPNGVESASQFSFAYGWQLNDRITPKIARLATAAEIADWKCMRSAAVATYAASDEAQMFVAADRMSAVLGAGQLAADADL